jgi:anthranilate phosphoribosyltransferase
VIDTVQALQRLLDRQDLSRQDTEELFGQLMDGGFDEAQKAALMMGLAVKGETASELAGAAAAMRQRVLAIPHRQENAIDTCGTGGDGHGTLNISTAAALVAAAAGAKVAKHGNRSVSSRSGSADVLAHLGVGLDVTPDDAGEILDRVGIAFLFAPRLHPAMAEVMPVRRSLGVRTLFNLLGPLTNPAGARRQLVGVYARDKVSLLAHVLAELGSQHALVVHGADGLDEITITGPTWVAEVRDGLVKEFTLTPEAFGIDRTSLDSLRGGSPEENAEAVENLLGGAVGPYHDIVSLNAGAALYVAGEVDSIGDGVTRSRTALLDGRAAQKLNQLREATNR